MKLFQRIARTVSKWFGSWDSPLIRWLRGEEYEQESDSGITVSGKTVLQYAPIWHLVSRIAGHVAQIPRNVIEEVEPLKSRVAKHPAQKLVKYRANSYMAADVFFEVLQMHALLWGNGRAAILRNNRNDPAELIPLLPDRTVTVLANGEKWHVVTIKETGEKIRVQDADVLHIMGLSFDGVFGYSLIEMARNSIGLGLASEKSANKHFKNNAMPGLVIEAPPGMFRTEAEAKKFLNDFNGWYSGVDNTNKAALMREGMKANALTMNGRDSQWIEQRRFQRQEAALWMACESILGDDSSVSYNSLEQKNMAYLSNCLNRWLVRWETELREKLLTALQKRQESHYIKFNRNALLSMSANERADFYTKMVSMRAMSPNEVRTKEDMDPYEGGDEFQNPHINPTPTRAASPEDPARTPPKQPQPDEESDATDRIRQLITARLTPLVNAERRVAAKAAATERNFCAWLESYYGGDAFLPQLSRAVLECGGTPEDAEAYVHESKQALLTAAGVATADNIAQIVAAECDSWASRVEKLADELSKRTLTRKAAA